MLAHLFDRFYVVTKLILPIVDNLKLSLINYNKDYDDYYDNDNKQIKINIKDLITYCTELGKWDHTQLFIKCKSMSTTKMLIIY